MLLDKNHRRRLCITIVGFIFVLAGARVPAANSFGSVYISELLVAPRQADKDTATGRSGWIELYNAASFPVNLTGWFLTDDPNNLTKWRFPEMGILPGTYLLISTPGKASTNGLPQTNFQLRKEGGYLALVGSGTNVVSDFGAAGYPKQSAGVSYGRLLGEPQITGYFSEPTPGKPNQIRGPGFAPSVRFSPESGAFVSTFSLELSCEDTNAMIYYTLDGKLPTRESARYREPLVVTNTAYVRARAFLGHSLPGPPRSESYQLLGTNVTAFGSRLPVLVMNSFGSERSTSARSSFVQLAVYEPTSGRTSFTNTPGLATRGGFHIRGSTSAQMPQPPFALQFLDEFDHEVHLPILGLPANSDWVLYAPTPYDPVMIHNPFIHQLSRDMGHYSPRTRFVEVFMVRHPGPMTLRDYYGVYVLEEKIKVGKHRVAIDRLGPEDLSVPEVTGGYLLKFDRLGPGESGLWAGGTELVYVEPKEPVISLPQRAPQREYINRYLDEFEKVLHGPKWKNPAQGYRAYIDVDSWIDFHVLEVLSGNVDAFKFSTFFYKPRGGKLTFGPHWDFDRALGSPDYRDNDPAHWNTGRFFDGPWLGRLFRDPDFWQLWVDRWQELRGNLFSETNLFRLVDELADQVRAAQPREEARWGLEPRGGTYQAEVDWMKNWLQQRMEFIDHQLTPRPHLVQELAADGALKVTLNGPTNATVYYTLDGTDPRMAQGGVSSNAVAYSEPIVLKGDARVIARARNPDQRQVGGPPLSTPWSAAVTADCRLAR